MNNKLKTIVLFTTLFTILLSCGGPQNKRKMHVPKFKHEKREMIKPINIEKEILKNDTIVTIVTTATYSVEDFAKLEEQRKRWTKKKKDHGKNKK